MKATGFSSGFRALIGMAPGRYVPRKPVNIPRDPATAPPQRSARAKLSREQEADLASLLEWRQ